MNYTDLSIDIARRAPLETGHEITETGSPPTEVVDVLSIRSTVFGIGRLGAFPAEKF